jgi:hypothetical protein
MKNFYEATVTKSTLNCRVKLTLTPVGSLPCKVISNDKTIYEDTISSIQTLEWQVSLTDSINVQIQVYRHHPDAVAVALTVDDIEVLPKYQHLATPATCYIDSNTVWQFNIPNFYPWYHQITGQGWIA